MSVATSPTDVGRVRQLARVLLDRSGVELADGVDRDQVVSLLARVLARWPSPGTSHGKLVLNSLLPRSMPRDAEEDAVRRVVAGGRAPWPRAVAGQLRQEAEAARAWEARLARLRPLVDQEGPRAAEAVVALWQSRGKAPGPQLVAHRLGWAKQDTWPMLTVLLEAGYLTNERRRLTPGPKAAGQFQPSP